jgi:hypothetical protein
MDPFRTGREGEEELFGFIRTDDGGAEPVERKMALSF